MSSLSIIYKILINSIINKLIEFSNNNKLKGDNNSLNIKYTRRIINNKKPGNNAFILKYLTVFFNYTANKYNDNDININIIKS